MVSERIASLESERSRALESLQRAIAEEVPTHAHMATMTLKGARFTNTERDQFASMLSSDALTSTQVRSMRALSIVCPEPVPERLMSEYIGEAPLFLPDSESFNDTARIIVQLRSYMSDVVFGVPNIVGTLWYKFVCAVKQPVQLILQPL
eukprot:5095158-Amphidinium_carterae.1